MSDTPPPAPTVAADGSLRLALADELPSPLPDGVRRVVLEHPMIADHAAESVWSRLREHRDAIEAVEGVELRLELRVDADNWIHVPGWVKEAHAHGVATRLHLADESEPNSLAHVDHDVLATIRQMLRRWSGQRFGGQLREGDAPQQIRRWQRSLTQTDHHRFALPGIDHPLFADEELALDFLIDLLRIFEHPHVVAWLDQLVHDPRYGERFLESRPLRFAGYWLVASAQRREALPAIARFRDAAHVVEVHEADRAATRGGDWADWYDAWARELRIENLRRQRRPFLAEPATPAPSETPASPRLTVIIPSFRHEEFIERTVRSVLGQSATELVVLVSDDASDDGTVAAARAIEDPRLRVLAHEQNRGLGHNIAAALQQVDTPYVAILNSDDLFDPRRIERCLEVLDAREEVQLVATDLMPIDAEDRRLERDSACVLTEGYQVCHWLDWFETLKEGETGDALVDLLRANHLLTSSNLIGRREFFREEQRRWVDQEFCLDWQLLLAAAQRGGLHHLREPLLGYRLHARNTVWFDEERAWRYFVESHQVAAQVLRRELEALARRDPADPRRLLELLAGPLQQNTGLDGAGLLAALFIDQSGLGSRSLPEETRRHARTLGAQAEERHEQRRFAEAVGEQRDDVKRMLGQIEFLRNYRARGEVLEEIVGDLEGSVSGLSADKQNLEALWHQAEAERDREIEEKGQLHRRLDEQRQEFEDEVAEIKQALQRAEEAGEESRRALEERKQQFEEMERRLGERTHERDQLLQSGEYRLGNLILNKFKLFPVLRASETALTLLRHGAQRLRLRLEAPFTGRPRMMATACWNFPIYSQTFVYQELTQLQKKGYAVRFCYSHLEPRDHLPPAMRGLWPTRRKLLLHRKVNRRDFEHYRRRMPEKVERLIELICRHSGKDRDFVLWHDNFVQAFSYTRQAEALGVDYLHSYFFYDRSLMSLVAGYLLDLPRGVSCYADHLLDDYEFKLVPLHLELCDIVIATSARIKSELAALRPDVDPDKILVKPNAVDSQNFPVVDREDPRPGEPFRIVCVNRIEPKKGLTYLAEAVRRLNERGLNVEMHQVGEADNGIQSSIDYKQTLVEQLERDGLWGKVHLEGKQSADGVRRFLGMSQLFLAPFVETDTGDKDGIPTALLEAMATGIAIVSTDAGSMTEVIEDGVEGLVVPEKDAGALADAIESLLRDPERRKQLGRAAAQKVRERFDVSVCEQWFHDRLAKVLAARGVKAP